MNPAKFWEFQSPFPLKSMQPLIIRQELANPFPSWRGSWTINSHLSADVIHGQPRGRTKGQDSRDGRVGSAAWDHFFASIMGCRNFNRSSGIGYLFYFLWGIYLYGFAICKKNFLIWQQLAASNPTIHFSILWKHWVLLNFFEYL